jgi:hypothetical protein
MVLEDDLLIQKKQLGPRNTRNILKEKDIRGKEGATEKVIA